ncbi:MAG: hypothetical protein AAF587_10640 [Bacteroidota bacterium]
MSYYEDYFAEQDDLSYENFDMDLDGDLLDDEEDLLENRWIPGHRSRRGIRPHPRRPYGSNKPRPRPRPRPRPTVVSPYVQPNQPVAPMTYPVSPSGFSPNPVGTQQTIANLQAQLAKLKRNEQKIAKATVELGHDQDTKTEIDEQQTQDIEKIQKARKQEKLMNLLLQNVITPYKEIVLSKTAAGKTVTETHKIDKLVQDPFANILPLLLEQDDSEQNPMMKILPFFLLMQQQNSTDENGSSSDNNFAQWMPFLLLSQLK